MFDIKTLQYQLENNHFQIYLHPRYDATSSEITNVEAIVKYVYNNTYLDYKDFTAELEEKDLVGILDVWVLDKIFQLQEHTIEQGHSAIPFFVNVSAWTVSNPFNVYDIVLNFKKYSLPQGSIQATLTATVPYINTYGLEKGIGFLQRQGINMKTNSSRGELTGLPSFNELEDIKSHAVHSPNVQGFLLSDLLTQEEFYNIQRN